MEGLIFGILRYVENAFQSSCDVLASLYMLSLVLFKKRAGVYYQV